MSVVWNVAHLWMALESRSSNFGHKIYGRPSLSLSKMTYRSVSVTLSSQILGNTSEKTYMYCVYFEIK